MWTVHGFTDTTYLGYFTSHAVWKVLVEDVTGGGQHKIPEEFLAARKRGWGTGATHTGGRGEPLLQAIGNQTDYTLFPKERVNKMCFCVTVFCLGSYRFSFSGFVSFSFDSGVMLVSSLPSVSMLWSPLHIYKM